MSQYNFIEDIDSARKSRKGWTYVLVSPDRKFMKIGQTIRPVEERIKTLRYEYGYQKIELNFLLAIEGTQHESTLLHYFDDYRARYDWKEKEKQVYDLTCDEAWAHARKHVIAEHGKYTKLHTIWAWNKYVMVTRKELFKIPPRKVGAHLESLITHVLESHGS